MPVCSGSLHRLALRRRSGACSSRARRASAAIVAEAVDRVAERVDDAAEEAVADRHREDLAGAADRLALLDAANVAEDDDADLADVEVQREAQRGRPRTRAARWSSPRQALDARDAVAGLRDAADLFAGGRPGAYDRDVPRRARPGSPPAGSSAPSWCPALSFSARRAGGAVGVGRCGRAVVPCVVSRGGLGAACSSRAATVPSMTSSPIRTRMPPTTLGVDGRR